MSSSAHDLSSLRVCVDRIAPLSPSIVLPDGRLAGLRAKLWPAYQRTLHIRFLGGDPRIHQRIERIARTWTAHANVNFVFDNSPTAAIRISFEPGPSWSYLGTDALDPAIAPDEPTMNYGWLTPATANDELQRVVLHEFGHALGLVHEHQSPAADIPWDLETLYTYFAGPPNYWSPAQVDYNIIRRYEHDQTNFSAFDPMSIMLYPISPAFTGGKLSIEWNRTLSVTDREFIGQLYPAPGE